MSTQALHEEIVDTNEVDAVQFLTFKLDGESFATEIDNVREVLEHTKITRVPRTPEFMLGVINLRGSIVPVVDLRLQFDMPLGEQTVDTCIIIIEVDFEGELTVMGALADSVQQVVDLLPEQLTAAPTLGSRIKNEFISQMGKVDEEYVIILDLKTIFNIDKEMFASLAEMYHASRVATIDSGINDIAANEANHNVSASNVDLEDDATQNKTTAPVTIAPVIIDIDLDSAIQKHAQWKLKLHSAITKKEAMNVNEISRDDCCVLGKWLHGDAKKHYSHLNSYTECVKQHKAFHNEAGKVAQEINNKQYTKAERMLGSNTDYINVSKTVAAAIITLRKEIQ